MTAYDNLTRSELHNGAPFSRISSFTKPKLNDDGSGDLFFGPDVPDGESLIGGDVDPTGVIADFCHFVGDHKRNFSF